MSALSGQAVTEFGLIGAAVGAAFVVVSGATWLLANRRGRKSDPSRYRRFLIMGIAVSCFFFAIALVVNLATREAEHQSSLLSRSGLRQAISPFLEQAERRREKRLLAELASLEPIDAHTHITQTGPAFVGMLQSLHMHVLDILYVDDTSPYRSSLEKQKQDALNFIASARGQAALCTTFDPFRWSTSGFPQDAINDLNDDFAHGAVAAKVWKNIGMEIKNSTGQYVMPDGPMFEPIYQDIAAHNKTLVIHAADPDEAWDGKQPITASASYYAANPQWNMSTKLDAPQKGTILQARDHLLATNTDLRVIGAHLGSGEHELDDLGARFERYPNFAVDTAARIRNLAAQPRETVRSFLLKYQDRILYGTDLRFDGTSGFNDQAASQIWERQYELDWRYLATADNFNYHGRRIEGLSLPRPVLKKIFHDNAVRWIPGITGNVQ